MRIPVIVLSGFLGSGKTTLLLRLLKKARERGLQPGILMNELGRQDVDGVIVDEYGDAAIEKLLDGCVCCSKKSELAGSLKLLLRKKPDVIFIELTGVANPEEIADALTEPGLLHLLKLKQVVTLLDAEHALDYNSIFASDKQLVRTLRRQLEVADLVVVNKTDLVSPGHLQKVEKVIRKQNEQAAIAFATYSEIDLLPVLAGIGKFEDSRRIASAPAFKIVKAVPAATVDPAHREHQPPEGRHDHHDQHNYRDHYDQHSHRDHEEHHGHAQEGEAYRSFSRIQTVTLPVEPGAEVTKAAVERLLHRWRDQLLRAKGYLSFPGENGIILMQHAGKRTYWEPAAYTGDCYMVCIGIGLDEERLLADWRAIVR